MPDSLTVIKPGITDLGAFSVRRLLPSARQTSVGPFVFWDHFGPVTVGPFVFWDHFGPVTLPAGANMDVRPHPHIGLSTLTWLFEGVITHRDGLGCTQDISPGEVNWMTAGRGIVHSERTPVDRRNQDNPLHGLQIWLGLPDEHENANPDFQHYPADAIPKVKKDDVVFDLIAGKALGAESPVHVYSPLCYLAAQIQPGEKFEWVREYPEEAIYVVEGNVSINHMNVPAHHLAVFPEQGSISVQADETARIALFGGKPLGKRYLWWNFVASNPQRIREAAERWANGGFDRVEGDDEFIPLPENRPMPE
jgi:redox-sensitive bicupin YhaK (pirin superfamily)